MSYSIKPQKNSFSLSLDKVLFIIACFYLGLATVWLVGQGKLKLPGMIQPSQSSSQIQQLSQSDVEFIAYLQQSLNAIDRQTKAVQAQSSKTIPPAVVSVPPPPSTPTYPTRVIERVYVPVYPQNSAPVAVRPSQVLTKVDPPLPPPPPSVRTSPVIPLKPTSVPILTPRETVVSVAPSGPTIGNTLVGVLELGDRSSALFNNNGITKRIALGEAINGWKLVSVQDRQVILERNGRQQILEVGRSF